MARTARKQIGVYDEGVSVLDDIDFLDFIGSGVVATDGGLATVDVTIGGGSSGTWTTIPVVPGQTVYAVSAEPKIVITEKGPMFDGFGYTYSALTIAFDFAPSDFIRYQ